MRRLHALPCVILTTLFLAVQLSHGRASITCTGDVKPSLPWSTHTRGYVGYDAYGSLTVDDGSNLISEDCYIGCSCSASGHVTVDGAGSTWTNSDVLCVSRSGGGSLNIIHGAEVNSSTCYIGYYSASSGKVTVDGAGSIFRNSGDLYVGYGNYSLSGKLDISGGAVYSSNVYIGYGEDGYGEYSKGIADITGNDSFWNSSNLSVGYFGKGTLNISEGAAPSVDKATYVGYHSGSTGSIHFGSGGGILDTRSLYALPSQLTGEGTINTRGFVSDLDLVFDSTHGLSRVYTFDSLSGQNITVNLDLSGVSGSVGDIGAGFHGSSSLSILDGETVNSANGCLGFASGSTGTGTVDGSTWSMSGILCVGYYGHGTLGVSNASTISSSGCYIGYNTGSTGGMTIAGADSTWTNSGKLQVGYSGNGTLNVADGAAVNISSSDTENDSYIGFEPASTGNDGNLYVGNHGDGTLNVSGGAVVSVDKGTYVGCQPGSTGTIHFGSGGGTLSTRSLYSFVSQLTGEGTINARGLVSDINLVFDSNHGLNQILTFDSLPGQDITVNLDLSGASGSVGDLGAGYRSSGSLSILDGVSVSSANGFIGFASGSTGTASVDGSTWSVNGNLYVGYQGDGTLDISNASTVSNSNCYIAYVDGSKGEVTVDGEGTSWTTHNNLYVGHYDSGALNITGGAKVSNFKCWVGYEFGTNSTVTVDGAGTTWTNRDELRIGHYGTSFLNITNGAVVSCSEANVDSGTTLMDSEVTVDGPGSTWTIGGLLYIQRGNLYITNGAEVCNTSCSLNWASVTVDGDGSVWTTDSLDIGTNETLNLFGGTVSVSGTTRLSGTAGTINFGSSGGTLFTQSLRASPTQLTGTGTINTRGLVSDVDFVIDSTTGLTPTITLTDLPGQNVTINLDLSGASGSNGDLGVGYRGNGSMVVRDGIVINSAYGYIGYESGSTGTATVEGADSTWNVSEYLYVGSEGNGTLNVIDGANVNSSGYLTIGSKGSGTLNVTGAAAVSNSRGYVGSSSSGTGAVTVDGAGSTWTNSDVLYVGESGSGTLAITNGGAVSNTIGKIAYRSGSTGVVTVDGADSTWTNSDFLYVGEYGSGTLNVTGGGKVSNDNRAYIGYGPGGSSIVTVDGPGSTWTNSNLLCVGYRGNGTLNITGGAKVSSVFSFAYSYAGCLGNYSGTTGTVTVDGPDSTWDCSGSLRVGHNGVGTLNITGGGTVSNTTARIGVFSGSNSTVTVDGASSNWFNSANLYVGNIDYNMGKFSDGTLNISGGGTVSVGGTTFVALKIDAASTINFGPDGGTLITQSLVASPTQLTGTGTIDARGLVSDVDLVFDSPASLMKTITFNQPGQNVTFNLDLSSDPSGNGDLGAGYQSNASLEIQDGMTVHSRTGYLGYESGSTGTATVDGDDSTWNNSDYLYVGRYGTGTLNITGGAEVSNSTGIIGYWYSMGVVTVDGAGSTWTNSGDLYVSRYGGSGTLNISGGGTVSVDGTTFVDYGGNSTGVVNFGPDGGTLNTRALFAAATQLTGTGTINARGLVSDVNLVFDSSTGLTPTITLTGLPDQNVTINLNLSGASGGNGDLGAGFRGNGSMIIRDGNVVNSATGYLGYESGSTGAATVEDAGSAWNNSDVLYVGRYGDGTLNISGAADVSNSRGYIGYDSDSTSTVTIDGAGSKWSNSENLYVGRSGSGTLNITDGAKVSNSTGYVGYNSNSIGVVTVDGAGSNWSNSGDLYVGRSDSGTLNISGGGSVSVAGTTYVAYGTNSTGAVNFGPEGGTLTTQTLWAAPTQLTGAGTINVCGLVSDVNVVFDSSTGLTPTITLTDLPDQNVTINLDLSGASGGDSDLGVGFRGNGSMTIREGIAVNSTTGYIGYEAGSAGAATVEGAGSTWNNGDILYVGYKGNGTLNVTGGANIGNTTGYIGYYSDSTGDVSVVGSGSKWTNDEGLYINSGSLNISGGGYVSADSASLSISKPSLLVIDVGNNSLLELNGGSGTIGNFGTISVLAGAGVAGGGVYSPISAGTWEGSGIYQAVGGTWNGTTHEFTVSDVVSGDSGTPFSLNLAAYQRALIVNDGEGHTGWSLGASFLDKAGEEETELLLTATAIGTLDDLEAMLASGESVLSAWNIELDGDGYTDDDPVYLSFDIGAGYSRNDLQVWYFDGSDWSEFDAMDLTCNGVYASFTATDFSGYAVTVPEPGTLILLFVAALELLIWVRGNRRSR